MTRTWVLIADSHRGRLFERQARGHALLELADFVYPNDRATGHAGTQFEPHTDLRAKDRRLFSQLLAAHLNDGVASQQYSALVLIAPGPMLGDLRLNVSAGNALRYSVDGDLTHFEGTELQQRVDQALQFVH
jgi:protein required for attachment to host cells